MEEIHIPQTVKAVLFDAVGTVLRPVPAVSVAYHDAGRRFGSRRTVEQVVTRFRRAFAQQEAIDSAKSDYFTNEQRERDRWRTIVAEVFDDVADSDGLFDDLWEHFAQARHWQLFDDVVPAWIALAQRGVWLGIASNFDARLEQIVAQHPPLQACVNVFVSSLVGYRKPSREFFSHIERALALRSDELLLVGDDQINDYHAARRAGWHAVLVARDGPPTADTEHFVCSLADL